MKCSIVNLIEFIRHFFVKGTFSGPALSGFEEDYGFTHG